MMNEDKFSLMGSELTDEQASTDYKSDAHYGVTPTFNELTFLLHVHLKKLYEKQCG